MCLGVSLCTEFSAGRGGGLGYPRARVTVTLNLPAQVL